MGKALYRKHRPKTLKDVIGQEHITDTLTNALKANRISHAYLFTGPRGVGKTSVARILAHQINDLPYTDESNHLDIIEIDAASNNGVEDVRALRERVAIAPTSAKFKVYIIDEVHMLSKPAFNALLKTLEEPPEHVVFILATTETHKLPDTIISRTQKFGFKPVAPNKVVAQLRNIATQEKIDIDNDALRLIADHGEGSFRDSISLLDQISNSQVTITADTIMQALGQAPEDSINNIINAINSHDISAVADELNTLKEIGTQSSQFAKQLCRTLTDRLVSSDSKIPEQETVSLIRLLLEVPAAYDIDSSLELALYTAALANKPENTTSPTKPSDEFKKHPKPTQNKPNPQEEKPVTNIKPAQKPIPKDSHPENKLLSTSPKLEPEISEVLQGSSEKETTKNSSQNNEIQDEDKIQAIDGVMTKDQWQEVLNALKGNHNTLYGITRMANPEFEADLITLRFKFAFHQKRINEEKTKHLLDQIIFQVTGQKLKLNAVHDKSGTITSQNDSNDSTSLSIEEGQSQEKPDIVNISNIFGGAEIVK